MSSPRYAVVGSGSAANSYIFEVGSDLYVIDNGFSLKQFKIRVADLGFEYTKIKAIFLTHIHSDHLKGVGKLSWDLEIPVYTHVDTDGSFYKQIGIESGKHYELNGLNIMPFDLSHDAPDAIGYYFKIDDKRFTLITDTGVVTPIMYKLALGSDILFLEANYCEEMLKHGSYPISVKNRISSNLGHLSNRAAINFLNDLYDDDCSIRQIFLCHLSKNNNSVEAVQRDFDEYYDGDIPYRICNRDEAVSYKEVIR